MKPNLAKQKPTTRFPSHPVMTTTTTDPESLQMQHLGILEIVQFAVLLLVITTVSIVSAKWLVFLVERMKNARLVAWQTWRLRSLSMVSAADFHLNSCILSREIVGCASMYNALKYVAGPFLTTTDDELARIFVRGLNSPADKATSSGQFHFSESVIGVLPRTTFVENTAYLTKVKTEKGLVAALIFVVEERVQGGTRWCVHIGFVNRSVGSKFAGQRALDASVYGTDQPANEHFVGECEQLVPSIKEFAKTVAKENVEGGTTVNLYGAFDGAGLAVLTAMAISTEPVDVSLYTEGCPRILSRGAFYEFRSRSEVASEIAKASVTMLPCWTKSGITHTNEFVSLGKLRALNIVSKHDPWIHLTSENFVFHTFPILLDLSLEEAHAVELERIERNKGGFLVSTFAPVVDIWFFLWNVVWPIQWLSKDARSNAYNAMFSRAFTADGFTKLQYLLALRAFAPVQLEEKFTLSLLREGDEEEEVEVEEEGEVDVEEEEEEEAEEGEGEEEKKGEEGEEGGPPAGVPKPVNPELDEVPGYVSGYTIPGSDSSSEDEEGEEEGGGEEENEKDLLTESTD